MELVGLYIGIADGTDHAWDGEWHHWMCYNDVLAITGSKLYVDGTLIAVNTYKTTGTVSNLNSQSTTFNYRFLSK